MLGGGEEKKNSISLWTPPPPTLASLVYLLQTFLNLMDPIRLLQHSVRILSSHSPEKTPVMQANSRVSSQSEEMEFICHLLFLENSEPANLIMTYIYNHVHNLQICTSTDQPDLLLLIIKLYTR